MPCLAITTLVAAAAVPGEDAKPETPFNWLESIWNLPILHPFSTPAPSVQAAVCSVSPLNEITDSEALEFEQEANPNTAGLLPAMRMALERFRRMVASAGGTFELKSAYRPAPYQEHLQDVWFKWMRDLRNNHEPGCQPLRAEVSQEFARHHLLESQMPVTSSDHTRGMAFDALVVLPHKPAARKRSVSLDRLALLAGLKRPDIRHDPVHFKLVIARRGTRS